MKTTNLLRVPRLSVLLLLFLLGTGPIFAQWLLEVNLGINIFDLTQSKYYLTYSVPGVPDGTAETECYDAHHARIRSNSLVRDHSGYVRWR